MKHIFSLKYLGTFLMYLGFFSFPLLKASLSEQIRGGAEQLKKSPNELKQIPVQLITMFETIRSKIPDVDQGITKIEAGLQGVNKAKADLEKNAQAPDIIKLKILDALSKLQITLPRIKNVFINLKNTMQSLVTHQKKEIEPIENLIEKTFLILRGVGENPPIFVFDRLSSLADVIAKGEDVVQHFQQFGEDTKEKFQKFGDDTKKTFDEVGNKFKKAFHIP